MRPPSDPPPLGPTRRDLLAWTAALAGLVALAHARVAFLGETFVFRDGLDYMLQAHHALGESLRAGRLPEWADWVGIGVPAAANPMNGAAYPPFWLSALLPAAVAKDLLALLHVVLGGVGVAVLAARLGAGRVGAGFGGAVFATCGYVASMPPSNNAHLLCWLPWVAAAADRVAAPRSEERWSLARDAAWLAAALAAQLLVGEPAHVAAALLLAGVVVLVRARRRVAALLRAAAAGLAALPLAAVALLPGLAVLGWTTRAGGMAAEARGVWSMPAVRALEWIWPGLLGRQTPPGGLTDNLARALDPAFVNEVTMTTWAPSLHVGVAALALAAWAAWHGRAHRWLLAASALFVLLALGSATPLGDLLAWLLPPARLARYPEKYLVGALVLWAALAGVGFDRLLRSGPDRRLVGLSAGGAAALGAALAVGLLLRDGVARAAAARTAGTAYPVDGAAATGASLSCGASALAVALAIAALLALAPRLRLRAATVAAGVAVLALGELVARSATLTPTMPRGRLEAAPPLLAAAAPALPPAPRTRVWTFSTRDPSPADFASGAAFGEYLLRSARGNVPAYYGLAAFPGHSPVANAALARLVEHEAGPSLLGIEYVILAADAVPPGQPGLVATDPVAGTSLVRIAGARPKAFVTPRWIRAGDPLALLASGGVDPATLVLAGAGPGPAPADGAPALPCEVFSPRPEQVDLTCASPAGGYATALLAHAPGWTATVNGAPAPIEVADTIFPAVRVGPGVQRVALRYRTPWLRAGAAVSLAAWAAWAALIALSARRRRVA